ncbi:MAG: hypothetical protein EA380_07905, partial [Phycisphaeraceae bacterium]
MAMQMWIEMVAPHAKASERPSRVVEYRNQCGLLETRVALCDTRAPVHDANLENQMNRKHGTVITAAVLVMAAASGTAWAQYQNMPARQSVQLAHQLGQMQTSLADAIKMAERHTDGVAIGVRMSSSRELFGSPSGDGRSQGNQYWESTSWSDRHQDGTHPRAQDTHRQHDIDRQGETQQQRLDREREAQQRTGREGETQQQRLDREREAQQRTGREGETQQQRLAREREAQQRAGREGETQQQRLAREREAQQRAGREGETQQQRLAREREAQQRTSQQDQWDRNQSGYSSSDSL